MDIKAFFGHNSITHETTWEEVIQYFPSRHEAQKAMQNILATVLDRSSKTIVVK